MPRTCLFHKVSNTKCNTKRYSPCVVALLIFLEADWNYAFLEMSKMINFGKRLDFLEKMWKWYVFGIGHYHLEVSPFLWLLKSKSVVKKIKSKHIRMIYLNTIITYHEWILLTFLNVLWLICKYMIIYKFSYLFNTLSNISTLSFSPQS